MAKDTTDIPIVSAIEGGPEYLTLKANMRAAQGIIHRNLSFIDDENFQAALSVVEHTRHPHIWLIHKEAEEKRKEVRRRRRREKIVENILVAVSIPLMLVAALGLAWVISGLLVGF